MHIYFPESGTLFLKGCKDFLILNWPLLMFILLATLAYIDMSMAVRKLPHRSLVLKGSKPVDFNFGTPLVSYILPFFKFAFKGMDDWIFFCGATAIWLVLAFIYMNAYQFNVVVRLFGFRHYEVQTIGEISFLMLSKKKIINKADAKVYVPLTDHMIINAT